MPIGKDSITKRVAKVETPANEVKEEKIALELVATTAAAPKKAPAKKTATTSKTSTTKSTTTKSTATKSTATKSTASTAKKAPSKKPATETLTPPAEEPKVATNVLSNVAPETVEAVIGHKEKENFEKVQIGEKMPEHLL